jgi:4-hydroxybenzoate polyprenyltransferase
MKKYLSLVKFSHTIFALPFALIGYFLAVTETGSGFDLKKFILVLACMVFARSAAMAFNRYIDRKFDKLNPRTAVREIPAGVISEKKRFDFCNSKQCSVYGLLLVYQSALFLFGSCSTHGCVGVQLYQAFYVFVSFGFGRRIEFRARRCLCGGHGLFHPVAVAVFGHRIDVGFGLRYCLCLAGRRV